MRWSIAQLQRHWDALRHGPEALPHKQIVALAGRHYRELAAALDVEPGEPAIWGAARQLTRDLRPTLRPVGVSML